MNNEKDFLAKEPLGKLLMRLALPTVAAQLINMLYNIVDRMYIGHIPDVGALALTGVGVCMPLIMIVSAFAALVGNGGAPSIDLHGKRGERKSGEDVGKLFYDAADRLCGFDGDPFALEPEYASSIWSER